MPAKALVAVERNGGTARASRCRATCASPGVAGVLPEIEALRGPGPLVVDGAGIEALRHRRRLGHRRALAAGSRPKASRCGSRALSPRHAELLATVEAALPPEDGAAAAPPGLRALGRRGRRERRPRPARMLVELLNLLGAVLARLAGNLFHPARMRFTSLVSHMQQAGLDAVPDRRADGLPDRRRARLHGRGAAPPVRRRDLRRRPDRDRRAARARHPAHRHHRRRTLRLGLHRRRSAR